MWTDSRYFVNQIFNADNSMLSKSLLDDFIVYQRKTLVFQLAITTLVDELADCFLREITVRNVGLNASQHVNSGLVKLDEHSVMKLPQTEELKNFLGLGSQMIDTI